MTELEKPVSRRAREPFGHYRKRIVVSLEPGDTISMRLERTRTTYRAPLQTVFRQLAQWQAEARTRERRENRKGHGIAGGIKP